VIQQHLVTYEVPDPDKLPDPPTGWFEKFDVGFDEYDRLFISTTGESDPSVLVFRDDTDVVVQFEHDEDFDDVVATYARGLFENVEREVFTAARKLLELMGPRVVDRHKPRPVITSTPAPRRPEDMDF
jgi:hypothetical protein